ncbi:aminomethyltransferase family protein [Dasania sp. GY-MA-18]|uniref:Aminomethyltransferase family protein n=1 Tax=Dasania phycosphaerae TaxID=2950436 RepID=A0A9J6RHJ8_9GAMM|nr:MULTISPECIES: aminomethyltransferase family protein [Dasania]MCR8921316.1 aminomethyltransferase family protein [Dasania sp. GY-MA-18]MCZ0863744.1 aminomethyltransferase family protein [Dasania phycosphaerae]MCZ0867472.1 aminomethyltransferase family protein [Dasania phycosphaerae]
MSVTAKKSLFYDFVSRYEQADFDTYMANAVEDEDYFSWHGYCLPNVYGDEEQEYNAVRNGCALFDATPVKKYRIRGANAGAFMDYVFTRKMSALPVPRATYAIWCNEDGMLNDDALLYKLAEDDYLLMVAEVDHDVHFANCKEKVGGDIQITEETPSLAGFAVQGPKSCAVLKSFGFEGIENMKPFEVINYDLKGGNVMVSRVGFTADLGYEIWFKPDLAKTIEQAFIEAEKAVDIKIAGYGLTAIQLCRMEGGLVVPGWDTLQTFEDPEFERSPLELAMGWNVGWDREDDFVGKAALLKEKAQGSRFKMKGFIIKDECELEDGAELFATINGEDLQIGTLPSVSWSFSAKHWLGLSSLRSAYAEVAEGFVRINGEKVAVSICSLPFVNFERRTQVPAPL